MSHRSPAARRKRQAWKRLRRRLFNDEMLRGNGYIIVVSAPPGARSRRERMRYVDPYGPLGLRRATESSNVLLPEDEH